MQILQKPAFQKVYKKLKPNQRKDADAAIDAVIADPAIGEMKKGDLAQVAVYKFRMVNQLTLLAYCYDGVCITLTFIAIGTHENFCRNLKNK